MWFWVTLGLFVWTAPSTFIMFLVLREEGEITVESAVMGIVGVIGGWITVAVLAGDVLSEAYDDYRDVVIFKWKDKYSKGEQE